MMRPMPEIVLSCVKRHGKIYFLWIKKNKCLHFETSVV